MVIRDPVCRLALAVLAGICLVQQKARAGNEANFVLYDHHTDAKGTTELNLLSDYSGGAPGDPSYVAQLLEMERAITDQWMGALYFEGDKIEGDDYAFGGWRVESRYRLFPYGVCLNPVLSLEYANLRPDHRYLLEVVGRTDEPETQAGSEIESRLILGQDINEKLDVAFNWINDVNLSSGDWEFGYAAGLNYALFEQAKGSDESAGPRRADDWSLKELKLGTELFGGLGDSALGLTLDPNVTQQYAELNLRSELNNGLHVQLGGAVGLSKVSEPGLLRLMFGYEFE
jgi:hypothetical protein